jgi:hypothetical protein
VPRWIALLTVTAVLALAGCSDDDPERVGLTEPEACRAVREKLDVEGLEKRFGEPDSTQDFFGDRVVTYERGELRWQFQLTEQAGTFRVIQVRGKRETILACRA